MLCPGQLLLAQTKAGAVMSVPVACCSPETCCTPPLLSLRKLHTERQELIRQWDEAMDAMKQRDGAILVGAARMHACLRRRA